MTDLIALARENLEAFNTGNWDRMREAITPECVYFEAATGRRVAGADAFIEVNQAWKTAFPDARGVTTSEFAAADRVVIEVTWTGTQSGALELPGGGVVTASGRRIETPAVQLCRAENGKLAQIHHYFDLLGMLEQLGTISADELASAS